MLRKIRNVETFRQNIGTEMRSDTFVKAGKEDSLKTKLLANTKTTVIWDLSKVYKIKK